jgi:hypothetical protein
MQPFASPVSSFPTAPPLTAAERDALILEWKETKATLDAAKAKEMELRRRIDKESGMFDPDKKTGTQTCTLGNGWSIKCTRKENYKVENKHGEAFQALAELASMSDAAARVAETLFNFEANLRLGEYKKLRDDERAVIDRILTIKEGTPELTLVPPKQK